MSQRQRDQYGHHSHGHSYIVVKWVCHFVVGVRHHTTLELT